MNLQVTNTFNKTSIAYYDPRYRQIVSMGGSRSSKSYSILQLLMLEMMSNKKLKITVWRDTKVTCRATVLEDFRNIIMFDDKVFSKFKENRTNGEFTYKPTGSRIIFEGADNIGKVLGGAQDISFFNEVTEFSKDVYLQITQRTSGKVLCDYNPSKDFWLEDYKLDRESVFIHSDFRDNAFCPPNIIKQLKSYEPWEPGSYEVVGSDIYVNGEIMSSTNKPPAHAYNTLRKTANEYMWLVYGLGIGSEKPNRIYKTWIRITEEHFESLNYESYFGIDFGTKNPTAMVEVKFDGDNAFYVYPRIYQPLTDIDLSLNTVVKERAPSCKKGQSIIVGDSAKDTYIQILRNDGHLAIKALKGGGSVGSGITVVQSFTIYFVGDVNEEHVLAFINEYTNYSWKLDRYNKSTDEPEKKDDHYMDALRYIITYLVQYLGIKM